MKNTKLLYGYLVMIIISIGILLFAIFTFESSKADATNEKLYSFNDNWKLDKDKSIIKELPITLENPIDNPLIISNILPDLETLGSSLKFKSSNQTVRIWIGEDLIYNFGYEDKRTFGNTPGSAWHFVELGKDSSGKTITIELVSHYNDGAGFISDFYISSKGALILNLVSKNLFNVFLCLLTGIIGLGLLLFQFAVRKNATSKGGLAYLGLLTLFVSIWSLLETNLVQIVYQYTSILTIITFLTLMLAPGPMITFIQKSYYPKENKLFDAVYIMVFANFFINVFMQFANISDFYETVLNTHIIIIATVLIVIVVSLKDYITTKSSDSKYLLISTLILLLFSSFDILRYYSNDVYDFALGFRFGFLIFIIMLAVHYYRRLVDLTEKGIKAEVFERLAYEDILTKLKNRTYFEKVLKEFSTNLFEMQKVTIVTFDMNYLKKVNDTCGHSAGDTLISVSADCIKHGFEQLGECFRIGGDEFAVVMKNASNEVVKNGIARMKEEIVRYNRYATNKVEIAYGYAKFNSSIDKNLENLVSRADKMMYERKSRMKEKVE